MAYFSKETQEKIFKILTGVLVVVCCVMISVLLGVVEKQNTKIKTLYQNLHNVTVFEVDKSESVRIEKASPIGTTTDGKGIILVDSIGTMWILDNFFAESTDEFLIALNDNGTKDLKDDEIVGIWLALE